MSIFIIKPVGIACNLRCEYCFYHGCQDDSGETMDRMDDVTLRAVIHEVVVANPRVAEFNWLGGEPLLAGHTFFDRVIELQKKSRLEKQVIINKIQTNGALVDRAWAAFLAQHKFNVGISLDGPKDLHDRFRHTAAGWSVHRRIEDGLGYLSEAGAHVGAICVVNSFNVDYPEELFAYFTGLGLKNFSFNDAKGVHAADGQPLPTTVSPEAYGRFICRIFDLWAEQDDPSIVIRQIRTVMQALLGGKFRLCTFSDHCHDFFDIHANGDVYPCEDHPSDDRFRYGNIRDGMSAILNSHGRKTYAALAADYRKGCKSCKWWEVCHGGCMRDYYVYNDHVPHRNAMCDAHQKFFAHVAAYLKRHAPGHLVIQA